jgi:alpha-L-fucosidase 2
MQALLCPRRFLPALAVAYFLGCPMLRAAETAVGARDMVVWYKQPAQKWTDASPLGNGLTAGMVFGGTKTERIALNNSSFWSGKPHDYDDPDAGKYFDQIKALMAEQKFQEAEKMADNHFWGIPKGQQAYQPIGDLLLTFDGIGDVTDYRRELDMETGVAKVTYNSGGVIYTSPAPSRLRRDSNVLRSLRTRSPPRPASSC